ncbi:twin-arginine translocation signal domain-containing protein [Halocatena pleomorpha]|uniref:Twin-arginine translocation signal domain-containing protein n=1 Tax=Halocatena pleomorpha TaxID=1785090 RepID=A0A3P3R926_9EURY|nr:twin-arginine translocation signal domain-containing protein [Halocatena pleomorpha]RRJ29962.1 twin-arginine translocation signal domain-containing protein [Halocatena pleomorpha]
MVDKDDDRSIESNSAPGDKSVPSRSRRGFLKQAAATSLVGLTGLTATTEVASATESADDVETQAPNRITVRGIADFTNYIIYSTTPIWGGDNNAPGTDSPFEYPQAINYEGTWYDYGMDGTIYADNVDVFRFEGYVAVPDTTGITYTVEDL